MKRRAAIGRAIGRRVAGPGMADDPAPRAPDARLAPEVARLVRSVSALPRFALGERRTLPRGSGPVMVIPGFMTSDRSTVVVRRFLSGLGYDVCGWGLGLNRGAVEKIMPDLLVRAERHAAGRALKLVGWSHGGVVAREATREMARAGRVTVARIVTMGTPVIGGPKYTATADRYAAAGHDLDALERFVAERNAEPIAAPVTAIYTRRDQIVHWRACLDPNPANAVEHVEVETGHFGLGFDPTTLGIIADRLAR